MRNSMVASISQNTMALPRNVWRETCTSSCNLKQFAYLHTSFVSKNKVNSIYVFTKS